MLIDHMDRPVDHVRGQLGASVKAALFQTRRYRAFLKSEELSTARRQEAEKLLRWWQEYLAVYRHLRVSMRAKYGPAGL